MGEIDCQKVETKNRDRMKRIAFVLMVFTAALFTVSCQDDIVKEQTTGGPMTISAVAECVAVGTKVDLIYRYDALWHASDQIYVIDASGNSSSFTLDSGAGTAIGSFKQDMPGVSFEGDVKAYYPASIASGENLVWPSTQSGTQTIPMYSSKTLSGEATENFSFKSLGAVLQIVFNSTVTDVTLRSIEIKDGEKTMSGTFTIDGNGQATITATDKAGVTLDLGPEGKALGKGANYFYIAIPAGNYKDLTLTFTGTDKGKFVMTGGKLDIQHNTVGRLTLTGSKYHFHTLPGVFAVSPGEDGTKGTDDDVKVQFAPGNLRYSIATQIWSFFDNQYDCGPATYDEGHDKEISLFTWGYGAWSTIPDTQEKLTYATEPGKSSKDFSSYDDWGGRLQDERTWRTLTLDEWNYVIGGRPDYKKKFAHATVCGVKGLIILPDYFEDPMTNVGQKPFVPNDEETKGKGEVFNNNIYALGSDWTAMEIAGAVFLPLNGLRNGTSINYYSESGNYWTSTAQQVKEGDPFRPTRLHFNDGNPGFIIDTDDFGFGVRLVTNVEAFNLAD